MTKWEGGSIFLVIVLVVFGSQQAFGILPFTENFDSYPNGWSESIVGSGNIFSDGGSVHFRHTGTGQVEYSISRTISTVGFQNIQIILTASQGNNVVTSMEEDDFLAISFNPNDGSNVQEILKDNDRWQGINDPFDEDDFPSNNDSQPDPTSTSPLSLGPSANNNPNFELIITSSNNSDLEDYNLIFLQVTGDPIQSDSIIGGKIIPIETASLLVSGIYSKLFWIFPILISVVGISLALCRK